MISIEKVKEVNNGPQIMMRTSDRWTGRALASRKQKGLQYLVTTIPELLYNRAKYYFGADFWTKNDCYYENHFDEFRADIEKKVADKEREAYAKFTNSILGR